MARTKKKGVDYFSHDCVSGKTLFIIEETFGNNGYATWFKLLEELGAREGHFIDTNNPADLHYLASKCKVSVISVTEMLDLFATLEAIDKDLWAKKIVWCQNFVDRIEPVYEKRKQKPPLRPDFCDGNNSISDISVTESTQSKVKESKEKNNTIPNGIVPPSAPDPTKILKEEYRQLQDEYTGKDPAEVYKAIKVFVEEKRPAFLEPYLDAWNIFAGFQSLAKAKSTEHRKRKITTRAREPDFDFFRVLASIKQNADYRGENKSGWKVEFNFIIESEKNYISILERYKEH